MRLKIDVVTCSPSLDACIELVSPFSNGAGLRIPLENMQCHVHSRGTFTWEG